MTRAWSIVVALLVASVALAGCTKKPDAPVDTTPTGNGTVTSTPTTPTANATLTPAPKPTVAPVKKSGAIQGPFEDSAKITLPLGAPLKLTVLFNLTGAQAGAPATAVVNVELHGPDNKILKSAVVGLGQSAQNVKWELGPGDAPLPGDYTLKLTQQAPPGPVPTGIPSGGVANYDLLLTVDY